MSWVNWELTQHQRDFEDSISALIHLRQNHEALRPKGFSNFDEATPESELARWYNSAGEIMTGEDWDNPETRVLTKYGKQLVADGTASEVLIVINGAEASIEVMLPAELSERKFTLVWDSALERPLDQGIAVRGTTKLDGPSVQLFTLV
jgi:glycogen operon protein